MISIPVSRLLEKEADLTLTLLAGKAGLENGIKNSRIQKPGLALAGFTSHLHVDRIQIIGLTEFSYLTSLSPKEREASILAFMSLHPCGIILTRGLEAFPEMIAAAEASKIPLLATPLMSSVFMSRIAKFLENALAPSTTLHGVLLDIFGVGILLLGKSGIGKSETALDLILRGHRLVTDDVVQIRKNVPDAIYGSSSALIKHHMEIRGLGILNIKDLFGVASVRDSKRIELVIELTEWDPHAEYDRLGTEERRYAILDVALPLLRIPVKPGRNTSSIIEVAARNQLLKRQGTHSAREFQERLNRILEGG